ncbi:hypothetical protein B7759_05022 [Burkholderia glumae]|nr:hypothetical protein CG017_04531 [Burkholderia glumae]QTP36384.1 hypothetical protein B7759_05022 [Burkholderia glumae]
MVHMAPKTPVSRTAMPLPATGLRTSFFVLSTAVVLESLTQVIHESGADDGGSQDKQSGMNIEASFEANSKLAESGKPGMRTLDDPTMPAQPFAAFDTAACNTSLDAALSRITSATPEVIPFVSVQFARALAWRTVQPGYRRNGIERRLECHRIVAVGSHDRDGQRNAACIYDDVSLRSELAAVGRVGAGFLALRGWRRWLHRGWRVPNRSGRAHAADAASPDAADAIHRPLASLADVANTSCHCRSPVLAGGLPTGCRFAAHTGCR